jgi:hypothetical protein
MGNGGQGDSNRHDEHVPPFQIEYSGGEAFHTRPCALTFLDSTARTLKVGVTVQPSFFITILYLNHKDLQSLGFTWRVRRLFGSKNCVTAML